MDNQTDRLLWEIIRSAVHLLTSDDINLVRQCAGVDCDWLFLDTSRSSNRRWCEMKTCGNRHEAREFYRPKNGVRPGKKESWGGARWWMTQKIALSKVEAENEIMLVRGDLLRCNLIRERATRSHNQSSARFYKNQPKPLMKIN